MRILMITGIFPPDIGGPATYAPHMATALTRRGHTVTVVTLSEHTDATDDAYPFRVVRLARHQRQPWRWLKTMALLVRLGRQADVLYVNGLALEAAVANLLLRKPMVLKVVGDLAWEQATNRGWVPDNFEDFQQNRYGLKVEVLRALRTWWTRRAHQTIVPSRYLARWVAAWGVPEEKVRVIYNAVDLPDSLSPSSVPLVSQLKVVTIGRLVPWKRIDLIIEAVGRCADTGLVIIGDGPEREHLVTLTHQLQLSDRVYFAGQKTQADTLAMLAACDLFVLNSTYEGLPHVVLEAIALGLPIVATDVGGVPEVVENGWNGQLLAATDAPALHETLARLLTQPAERQRLAAGARQTADRFRFVRMVDDTAALLTETTVRSTAQGAHIGALGKEHLLSSR